MATTPKAALEGAEQRDPGSPFVAKLRAFYSEHGYLSAKQIAALERVTRTRRGKRFRMPYAREIHAEAAGYAVDDSADYGLTNSWDWAGD